MNRTFVAFLLLFQICARADDLRVLYTGRTLGYLRQDTTELNIQGCPEDGKNGVDTEELKAFSALLRAQKYGEVPTLLVGMGDNLGPEPGQRVFFRATEKRVKLTAGGVRETVTEKLPMDRMAWNKGSNEWIDVSKFRADRFSRAEAERRAGFDTYDQSIEVPYDPAGCAIVAAKYHALVPGKYDFYLGPERLRQIARFVQKKSGALNTRFLAANLGLVTKLANPAPRRPEYLSDLPFTKSHPVLSFDVPDMVIPSMREITLAGALRVLQGTRPSNFSALTSAAKVRELSFPHLKIIDEGQEFDYTFDPLVSGVQLCVANSPQDPDQIGPGGNNCRDLKPDYDPLKAKPGLNMKYKLDPGMLRPGTNYGFCAKLTNQQNKRDYFCAPFSVVDPFFDYNNGNTQVVPPYSLQTIGKEKVAIFGAVEADFRERIGLLNYGYVNKDKRFDSEVVVGNPVRVLEQALQECEKDIECTGARKVLLAQMPADQAEMLGQSLGGKFALVIAQTDARRATADEVVERIYARDKKAPTAIVVPEPMYSVTKPELITVTLGRVEFGEVTICADPNGTTEITKCPDGWLRTKWTNKHNVERTPVNFATVLGRTSVGQLLDAKVSKLFNEKDPWKAPTLWSADEKFQRAALSAMRKELSTDVAILQKRDFFAAAYHTRQGLTPIYTLQYWLDRAIWKGDFVVRLEMSGAALKGAMAKSKTFATLDRDALKKELEEGRALVTAGIYEDKARGEWLINGEPVDDARAYSVAISDYLAYGDTGYPDFGKIAVPPLPRLRDIEEFLPLSDLVCNSMKSGTKDEDGRDVEQCRSKVFLSTDYFDRTSQRSVDATQGMTAAANFKAWPFLHLRQPRPETVQSPIERAFQQRPVWSLTLEKLEGAVTHYRHNAGTEGNLASRLGGIPNGKLTAPKSLNLSTSMRLRLQRSGRLGDYFALAEEAYTRNLTRLVNAWNGDVIDQKANMAAAESGYQLRLWPRTKGLPHLKLLFSGRFETQLAKPVASFTRAGDVPPLRAYLDRTYLLSDKTGLRWQGVTSWFETGYQVGNLYKAPLAYQFATSDGRDGSCRLDVLSPTLKKCVENLGLSIAPNSRVSVRSETRMQHGLFLNFRIQAPLPTMKGQFYVMENKGDFFYNRIVDKVTDTRYMDTWSHSLVIPFLGNLSLVPKFEMFLYKNKVDGRPLVTQSSSMTIQYRFDKHDGVRWRTALRYNYPTAAK